MCRVILYSGEDGYIVAEVPSLGSCISQGKTREEALQNIHEAMEVYINALVKNGDPIPSEQTEVIDLPLVPTQKEQVRIPMTIKLDHDEQEILNAYERGEFKSVATPSERSRIKAIALATLLKLERELPRRRVISIRKLKLKSQSCGKIMSRPTNEIGYESLLSFDYKLSLRNTSFCAFAEQRRVSGTLRVRIRGNHSKKR